MNNKPRVAILKTDGTNCDYETAHAFGLAGGQVETVLLNEWLIDKKKLEPFQILVLPGGFSYGDDIASGRILALELLYFLSDQLQEFIARDTLIIGICNGFQVLVRTGLLPGFSSAQEVTLARNERGNFECRWVSLAVEPNDSIFTHNLSHTIQLPIAHAEGNFFCDQAVLDKIESEKLPVLRYAKKDTTSDEYPYNPNGSRANIAGLTDKTKRIFGLMPHPERFIYPYQTPYGLSAMHKPMGLQIIENSVNYFL